MNRSVVDDDLSDSGCAAQQDPTYPGQCLLFVQTLLRGQSAVAVTVGEKGTACKTLL